MSIENTYASFGVSNAVMSSSDPVEHEQNMLEMDVRVRDGDTSIELSQPDTEETTDEEEQEEGGEEQEGDPEGDEPEGDELETLGEPDAELKEASAAIDEYAEGFQAMREMAITNGLDPAKATAMEAEYEKDGKLSAESYAALAAAGYTKGFIDSYIRGQEAVAEQFVAKVVDYAGGQEKFQRIIKHMESTSPESVESLYEAVERQDLKSIRTIINLGIQSQTKKFGKAPARNVQAKAPATPQARKAPAAQGYESSAAMVKDMSSSAYRLDPAFRAKVEARVAASRF